MLKLRKVLEWLVDLGRLFLLNGVSKFEDSLMVELSNLEVYTLTDPVMQLLRSRPVISELSGNV